MRIAVESIQVRAVFTVHAFHSLSHLFRTLVGWLTFMSGGWIPFHCRCRHDDSSLSANCRACRFLVQGALSLGCTDGKDCTLALFEITTVPKKIELPLIAVQVPRLTLWYTPMIRSSQMRSFSLLFALTSLRAGS
jgi:hypothetical protein